MTTMPKAEPPEPQEDDAEAPHAPADIPAPRVMTREQLRDLDRLAVENLGLPTILLMENAAIGAARAVERALDVLDARTVLVLAGPGNNGGDGLALARHLHIAGRPVRVLILGEPDRLAHDAGANLRALRQTAVPIEAVRGSDEARACERVADAIGAGAPTLIVDALLGTGASRPVEGAFAGAIRAINKARESGGACFVVSLDLPSGLDADTGRPLGLGVRADVTVTFAAYKAGFAALEAQPCLGEVELVPIGVPPELLARFGSPLPGDEAHARADDGSPDRPAHPRGVGRDAGE
jgi:NAD(P)H-hydrate epimerase